MPTSRKTHWQQTILRRDRAVTQALEEYKEGPHGKERVTCTGCHYAINSTPDKLIKSGCVGFPNGNRLGSTECRLIVGPPSKKLMR